MNYRKVLLALDINRDAEALLAKAESILFLYDNCTLTIIHVDKGISDYYLGVADIDLHGLEEFEHHKDIELMKEYMSGLSMKVDRHLVYSGNVKSEITDAIKDNGFDLLIMGHHKTGVFNQLFSDSESLLRDIPCDTLLIKL